ncbi:MAG: hypothetical protein ACI4DS_02665 [Eubacterium sp.]
MNNFTKEQLIEILSELKTEGENVRKTIYSGYFGERISRGTFQAWQSKIIEFLTNCNINAPEIVSKIESSKKETPDDINAVQRLLDSLIDLLDKEYITTEIKESRFNSEELLENIFNKFHRVARQLRTRHNNRETLNVNDEYDVQDLLHALLLLHFDDVRAEEWTPSYAGGAVRMDFLINDINTVIEVKKTRNSMTSKSLGEELIIDIEKYQSHQKCDKLYCFVYDPEGLLGNPVGIKKDLEKSHSDFLKVFIKPDN